MWICLFSVYALAPIRPGDSLTTDAQKLLQGSVLLAAAHHVAATSGRVARIFSTSPKAMSFYIFMNATTICWQAIDDSLPKRCFPMLKQTQILHMAACGWLLVALCLTCVAVILRDVVFHVKEERDRLTVCWLASFLLLFIIGVSLSTTDALFHVHHYMWAYVIALLAKYNTHTCEAAQAVALGIFNQQMLNGQPPAFFDNV